MKYGVFVKAVMILLLCITVISQPVLKVYASNDSSQLDFNVIDDYIVTEMDQGNIQGLAIGIVKGDEILYLKGYGTAGDKKEVNVETPFGTGSVAKTFTALAIRQLINEDRLEGQSYVKDYIEDFQPTFQGKPVNLTINQLLTHTSGFSKMQGGAPYLYNSDYSIKEVVEKSKSLELNRPAGTSYEYSNLNYIILGRIIEIVSGISYEDYIRNNIYSRLEMSHSYIDENKATKDGLSQGYTILYGLPVATHYSYPKGSASAGFMFCSIEDMTHYLICYLNKGYYGGNSVIMNNNFEMSEDPMENSFLNHWYDEYWFENTGNPRVNLYLDSYGHNGAAPNFTSSFLVNQKSRYAVVVMDNTFDQARFFKKNVDSSTICRGIMEYIETGKLPKSEPESGSYVRLIPVFLILLSLLLYSFISIRSMVRSKTKKLMNVPNYIYMFIDIILPILSIFIIPKYNDSNWGWLLASNPEINYSIIGTVFWLLFTGCIKMSILMLIKHRKTGGQYEEEY
jgi:CubicO group peptidase (beta-lactamase class C family)